MPRAAYYAPGVYVEEVPSAQQPIAGVGTSTAAFIGLVPRSLYIPVPNPYYDPVLAKAALELSAPTKGNGQPSQVLRDDLQKKQEALAGATAKLEVATDTEAKTRSDLETANKAVEEAVAEPAPPDDEGKKRRNEDIGEKKRAVKKAKADHDAAENALDSLNSEIETLTQAVAEINERLAQIADESASTAREATASRSAGSGTSSSISVEAEDTEFTDESPDEKLLKRSVLRPYLIEAVGIDVPVCETKLCTNFSEYIKKFGTFSAFKSEPENPDEPSAKWRFKPMHPGHHALTHAVNGFFQNGGTKCFVARIERPDQLSDALKALESIDEVAIIAAPGLPKTPDVWEQLMTYCEDVNRENVFAVLDSAQVVNDGQTNDFEISKLDVPRASKNAAYYFPHIEVMDPAKQLQDTDPTRQVGTKYRGRTHVPTSGHVMGIYARTDVERGVHKAPANCVVRGALEVKYYISKPQQETLNPEGVNAIRIMNDAVTVWGARTVGGDRNGEWKYINVRRLFLFLQESIDKGTQWIVFEPNDPALWSRIRLNVSAFLTNVWRNGALFGLTPDEAFYVKCDEETNPPEVRDLGMVVTEIGVAMVRPAEFVIFRITQSTGQRQG
jgi:phage tail sheath protein FI